nr:hypothetical protein [Tanacetum cinerariifolium]
MAEDENVAYNVVNEKTTYDLIKALSNMYEKPSASNKKGHFQNQYSNLVASTDKEVNMTARDFDDTLVCCIENTVEDHIMDSGASFHATYCKEKLQWFKLRSGKTLKDVRYIPGLKRRLISVGKLDEEGSHHQRQGDIRRIGMNMLASKGNVPDVQNVDIYFCKLGLLIPEKEWCGNDTSLAHLKVKEEQNSSERYEAPLSIVDAEAFLEQRALQRCSPPGDEREVEVLRSFNWPPSELIIGDGPSIMMLVQDTLYRKSLSLAFG